MIEVTQLRAGTIFEDKGEIFKVLSYQHIKMGRGSANIKVKVKNLRGGSTTEKSFINGARVQSARVLKKELQFLYKDDDNAYFMDSLSFEQNGIPLNSIEGYIFLKEGETFSLSFIGDKFLELNLPPKMEFAVAETGSSEKGNSVSNIYKDAVLENGSKTKVPLFIKVGDKIKIDTRTGEYSERS